MTKAKDDLHYAFLRKYIKNDNGTNVLNFEKLFSDQIISKELYEKFDTTLSDKEEQVEFFKDALNQQGITWCYALGFDSVPFTDHGDYEGTVFRFYDYNGKDQESLYVDEKDFPEEYRTFYESEVLKYEKDYSPEDEGIEVRYFKDYRNGRWVDADRYPKVEDYDVWFVEHISQ